MPAFDEALTVESVVSSLLSLDIPNGLELIVVDDGSRDATAAILDSIIDPRLTVIHHRANLGKGAAIATGIASATGSHLLIFDADSEYDPLDIPRLIEPLLTNRAEVVYGSRMSGFGTVHPSLIHALGNHAMTWMANLLYGSVISDLHTCLKLIPLPLVRASRLSESGFGLDTEMSAELLRAGFRPYEVPISYVGRSKEEGKKIRTTDALECIWILIKVRLRGSTSYGNRDHALAPPVRVQNDPPSTSRFGKDPQ